MKHTLFLIINLFLIFNSQLYSQIYYNSIKNLFPDKKLLANTIEIPEELIPLLTDTASQIIFNPSRGIYSNGFIYSSYFSNVQDEFYNYYFGTYREYYYQNTGPTFSIAGLLNCFNTKWFFQIEHGIRNHSLFYNNQITHNYIGLNEVYKDSTIRKSVHQSDDEYRLSTTTLKAANTGRTGFGGYSIGLFMSINKNEFGKIYNISIDDFSSTQNTGNNSKGVYTYEETKNRKSNGKYSSAVFGTEFSLTGEDWDLIAGLSYESNNRNENTSEDNYSLDRDSSNLGSAVVLKTVAETKMKLYKDVEYMPSFWGINLYYRNLLGLLGNDHFFVSFNSYYSKDEIKINESKKYNLTSNASGYPEDTSYAKSDSKTYPFESWDIKLTTGYIMNYKLNDIQCLAGIKISALKLFEQDLFTMDMSSVKVNYSYFETQFPIYINYSPAHWCSIFGGFNYFYNYSKERYEISSERSDDSNVRESRNEKISNSDEHELLTSSKSIYLGTIFRHSSGLTLQIFYDKELSTYQDWNISIGYQF